MSSKYGVLLKIVDPRPYSKNYGFLSPSFQAPIVTDEGVYKSIQDYVNFRLGSPDSTFAKTSDSVKWLRPSPSQYYEDAYYYFLRTYPGRVKFIKDYGLSINFVDLPKIIKRVEKDMRKTVPVKEPYEERNSKKWMKRLEEIVRIESVDRPVIKMLKDYLIQHSLEKYISFVKKYPLGRIFKEDPELIGSIEKIKKSLKIKYPKLDDQVELNDLSRWLCMLGCLDLPRFKKYVPPKEKRKYRSLYAPSEAEVDNLRRPSDPETLEITTLRGSEVDPDGEINEPFLLSKSEPSSPREREQISSEEETIEVKSEEAAEAQDKDQPAAEED